MLAPLWSLAVEEQFCLLLPLLIAFVSPKMLPRALLLAILAAPILRVAVLGTVGKAAEVPAYVLLPMRADSLLLGVLCAWAVRHYRHLLEERIKVLYGALAVFLVMLVLANSVFHVEGLENTVVALLWGCLLLVAVTKGVMPLRMMPLRMLAPLAYAAFMLHLPIKELCEVLGWGKLTAFALTFALAAVSWHLFEKRFVAWGKRFRYKRAISSSTPTPDPARA